ncbi:hypothetical protein IQ22_00712 [Pseudomonas duriflava]|uniref:MarR family transcriptional regulator n=1 Tax=Pseudomonas duriflava TaxID=459528 RepID=A0A562QLA5_9PSED|nr:MarR family transcriptional regulator [Pseudomonas duriflava]TWI57495.1 hypothetical protein IQ22_00712 [Pseudomonas duriflava]
MPRRFSQSKRRAVAQAILSMDDSWIALFGDLGLSDLSYSNLLLSMWLRQKQSLRKTDLYDFMPSISRRTAVKYVQHLIDQGLLIETSAEHDKRVRWVSLTPMLIERLKHFCDVACGHVSGLNQA